MYFLKSLLINFLVVFFSNHVLPGIEVTSHAKLPHVGGDLLFAAGLGLLNALICPVLRLLKKEITGFKIALIALILNFVAFALLKILPLGIHVMSVEGYAIIAVVVSVASFLTGFFDMKRNRPHVDSDNDQ